METNLIVSGITSCCGILLFAGVSRSHVTADFALIQSNQQIASFLSIVLPSANVKNFCRIFLSMPESIPTGQKNKNSRYNSKCDFSSCNDCRPYDDFANCEKPLFFPPPNFP